MPHRVPELKGRSFFYWLLFIIHDSSSLLSKTAPFRRKGAKGAFDLVYCLINSLTRCEGDCPKIYGRFAP